MSTEPVHDYLKRTMERRKITTGVGNKILGLIKGSYPSLTTKGPTVGVGPGSGEDMIRQPTPRASSPTTSNSGLQTI